MTRQTHRGPAPGDAELFSDANLPALRVAHADLCWLLDRGYASRSSLELVGNRYNLTERQRMALTRCACSADDAAVREQKRIDPSQLRGRELWIDGYNLLTILESALAGGIVLLGRDRCCRDIAGIHRRYKKVSETVAALHLIGETASAWGVVCCRWWLDKPISNSGRLKALILETAAAAAWNVSVELAFSPDHVLSQTQHAIASSDGIILERCHQWVNLAYEIISQKIQSARIIDLSSGKIPT